MDPRASAAPSFRRPYRSQVVGSRPSDVRTLRPLVAALGLALASGCSPEDPRTALGRELYAANCEVCHGERGLGDGPMAAGLPIAPVRLIEHVGHHTRAELSRLIIGGIPPAMPPHSLSEEQITLIVDYVWTLVPADQVADLREMQRQVEAMAAAAARAAPPTSGEERPATEP